MKKAGFILYGASKKFFTELVPALQRLFLFSNVNIFQLLKQGFPRAIFPQLIVDKPGKIRVCAAC